MLGFIRSLRIAFSMTCGIVAVLLCVLWVRSYWWNDHVSIPLRAVAPTPLRPAPNWSSPALQKSSKMLFVTSYEGRLSLAACVHRLDRTGWFETRLRLDFTPSWHYAPSKASKVRLPIWRCSSDAWGDFASFATWLPVALAVCFGVAPWTTSSADASPSALC